MIIRLTVIVLLTLQWLYWVIKAKEAHNKKPRLQPILLRSVLERLFNRIPAFVIMLQLLGIKLLPFPTAVYISFFGLILFFIGLAISISARHQLDVNWTNSYEYQIKRNHSLVIKGIYRYIRHPIYTGLILTFLGTELVVQSYLVFTVIFAMLICYYWGKREERILLKHFGNTYRNYTERTKMFIPFIF